MIPSLKRGLQTYLVEVFERYGLAVSVGLTDEGVSIRSQDKRVDVSNISAVKAQMAPRCTNCGEVVEPTAEYEYAKRYFDLTMGSSGASCGASPDDVRHSHEWQCVVAVAMAQGLHSQA